MSSLEFLKKKAELANLYAGLAQQEFKLEEFKENIKRIEEHKAIQLDAIKKLEEELKKMEG